MSQLKHSQKTIIRNDLEEARWTGRHSYELRHGLKIVEVSRRIIDLVNEDGVRIHKSAKRERYNGTWGIRYWLARFAPKDSIPVPYESDFTDVELDRGHGLSSDGQAAVELGGGRSPGAVASLNARRPQIAMAYYYEAGGEDNGDPDDGFRYLPWSTVCFLSGADEATFVSEDEAKRLLDAEPAWPEAVAA